MKYLFILLFIASFLYAETFEYFVDKPDSLYIGSPIRLDIHLQTDPDAVINYPQTDTLDIFILKSLQPKESKLKDRKQLELTYTYLPFDTGEHIFPNLEFTVEQADTVQSFHTSAFEVTVHSLVPDYEIDIKDIQSPIIFFFHWFDILLFLLLLALIVFLIYNIIRMIRKKETVVEQPIIDTTPAYELALEMIEELKSEKLLQKGEFLLFHFRISFILRFFLERYFGFHAVESTTSEIKKILENLGSKDRHEIIRFLQQTDMVKFAKHVPTVSQSQELLQWLENYISSFKAEPAADKDKRND